MAFGQIIVPPSYSGATSFGSVGQMQAAELAQQAQAASAAQQMGLARGIIGQSVPTAPSNLLGSDAGIAFEPNGLARMVNPGQLGAGSPPFSTMAQAPEGSGWGSFPLGGAEGAASEGAASEGGNAFWNGIKGFAADSPGGFLPSVFKAGAADGGGIMGGLGAAAGQLGAGAAIYAGGRYIAAPVVGGIANRIAPGTGTAASDATKTLAGDIGLGAAVGGAPGALVGAGVGGATALAKGIGELGDVNDYQKTVGQYVKLANSKQLRGTDEEKQFKAAVLAIHNGGDYYTADGTPVVQKGAYIDPTTGKPVAPGNSIAGKNASLGAVVNLMEQQQARVKGGGSTTSNGNTTPLQIQMGQAMANIGQNFVSQGNAMADTLRAMEGTAPAYLRPLIEADAQNRTAYANNMNNAMIGSTMIEPTIKQMEAQIAYNQQILSDTRSAALSAGSSGSGSLSSLVNGQGSAGSPGANVGNLAAQQQFYRQQALQAAGL